jgi:hypothetical protein
MKLKEFTEERERILGKDNERKRTIEEREEMFRVHLLFSE